MPGAFVGGQQFVSSGQQQMAIVDGVEGATDDADAPHAQPVVSLRLDRYFCTSSFSCWSSLSCSTSYQ